GSGRRPVGPPKRCGRWMLLPTEVSDRHRMPSPVASPSETPHRSASHRLEGFWAQKLSATMVIGTPMKAPTKPHRKAHKNTENNTMKGERASALPETRGSI